MSNEARKESPAAVVFSSKPGGGGSSPRSTRWARVGSLQQEYSRNTVRVRWAPVSTRACPVAYRYDLRSAHDVGAVARLEVGRRLRPDAEVEVVRAPVPARLDGDGARLREAVAISDGEGDPVGSRPRRHPRSPCSLDEGIPQKKWRPMLGRNPKARKKVGKMPPLLSGPKAKKLKTAGPQFPFSAAVATAPTGVRMTYSVTRYAGRSTTRGIRDQHLSRRGRRGSLTTVVGHLAARRPLGVGRGGVRGLRRGRRRRVGRGSLR